MDIKRRREQANMTQDALAKAANVSRVAIARYESGARTPLVSIAIRIARALNCTLDELMKD